MFVWLLGGALCDSASCIKKLRFRRILQFLKGATRGEVEPVLSLNSRCRMLGSGSIGSTRILLVLDFPWN